MPQRGVFQGELGLLSLFDLGQLLMLNGASGQLSVTRDGRRGFFFFDSGAIVNAVDDEYHEGDGAAYRLFTWRDGMFEFTPGAATGARTIEDNTEALMMEAARRMDEAGAEGGGQVDKLAARATSLEALREVFQSVASEASGRPEGVLDGDQSAFDLLRDPADALLFRPGVPQRLRSNGRWRTVSKEPLDLQAYDTLRGRLLERAPDGPQADAGHAHAVLLDGGKRIVVTHVAGEHEALWVRAGAMAPAGSARLDGELITLDALLARPAGLLLVAGPDALTAERLFHACVARFAETRGGTLLLVADHGRWSHPDRSGAVLHAAGADAAQLARDVAPDAAAFDLEHAAHAVPALAVVPRVIVAVVSPDAGSALARWCALVGRRWGDGIETPLGSAPVEVVLAPQAAGADGRLAFVAARLGLDAVASAFEATNVIAPNAPDAVPAPSPAAPESAETPGVPVVPGTQSTPLDAMAALAAELTRTLRKAA
jgi:hypothetical protein